MKKISTTLFFALMGVMTFAQVSLKVKSGDTELDASLGQINIDAEKDFGLFKTEMKTSYNITDAKIDNLKLSFGMQASDIFMTLEIAKSTGKTVDVVAGEFKKNKGQGWGVIAKNLGIKPGSDAFHALKGNAKKKNEKMKGNGKNKVKPKEKKDTQNNSPNKGNSKGKK